MFSHLTGGSHSLVDCIQTKLQLQTSCCLLLQFHLLVLKEVFFIWLGAFKNFETGWGLKCRQTQVSVQVVEQKANDDD
jgi:hypothetical protein